MEKSKWVYTYTSEGPIVGPMLCKDCGSPVDGEYRFMRTVQGNVCQCFNCGHKDIGWAERLAYVEEDMRNHILDCRRDTPEVILQRIKDAYFEGHDDAPRDRDSFDDNDDLTYRWEVSNAKQVYDILKRMWGL